MKSGPKREWFLFIPLFLREREIDMSKIFSKRMKFFCSRAAFKSSFFATFDGYEVRYCISFRLVLIGIEGFK